MNGPARTTALLATALLAACAGSPPPPSGPPRRSALPAASSPEEALPGVDLGELTAPQKKALAAWAEGAYPYCGAPQTVSAALRRGSPCAHARRMARLAAWYAAAGLEGAKLSKAVTDYYAGFDAAKRARLTLDAFGPPLGDPRAPVTLVEFSDFTCPFCQFLRPRLEQFVAERPGRVRLHFKPFPIESHANALEAAQAVEWARDQGAFWKYHDTLFDNPFAYDPDSLVDFARTLGLPADDLGAALRAGRYVAKVRASMAEAREAGLAGTPTLYFNGRMFRIPDHSDSALGFTLEDEEEWVRNGGWIRD